MPTPRVLSASCPECSAPVRITRDREIVTCRYCGHHAFVHFPGKPDPKPPPPPPPPPHVPVQHYYQSYYRPYAQYGHIHVDVLQRIHARKQLAAVLVVFGAIAFAGMSIGVISGAMPRGGGTSTRTTTSKTKEVSVNNDPYAALAALFNEMWSKQDAYRVEVLGVTYGSLMSGRSTVRIHGRTTDGKTRRVYELEDLTRIVETTSKRMPEGEVRLTLSEWCRFDKVRAPLNDAGMDVYAPLDFVLTNEAPPRWVVTHSDGRPGKVLVNAGTCDVVGATSRDQALAAELSAAPAAAPSPPAAVRSPPSRPGPKPMKTQRRAF